MIRKPHLSTKTRPWLAAGLTLLAIAGCPPGWTPIETDAKLVPFPSSGELLSYFRQQARSQNAPQWTNGWMNFGGLALPAAGPDVGVREDGSDNFGAGEAESQVYSTTNVQEAGVDESDVVKSDGTYFYIARETTLRVVRASPTDQLAEAARLDLDLRVSEMYLYGSKLLLLAQRYEQGANGWDQPARDMWPPYYVGSNLSLVEVDISDPTAPKVTKQVDLDGVLVDSRLTNERLILVLTIAPELPENPTVAAINAMPLDEFMPKVRDATGERDMVQWQDCLHPESPDGYFLTAVLTVDAADIESILHSVAVVAGAGTIYASTEALYITDAEYSPENDYRELTAIHKFAFDNDGAAQYVASGSVPGRLLNQFSLGEHEDHLRVATHVADSRFFGWGPVGIAVDVADTAQTFVPPDDYSAVYVLAQTGAELETVGAVENIAPDEDLHSARFLGDHGFVVTFRKIDPLFVLDLTDPNDPRVVGELKVPGFSDYLHPIDATHLIGVGKATVPTDEGFDWFQGVQVSLFDVSDWSNPTVVEQLTFGGRGSWSEVDNTHKAFTYLSESGLLALPMRLYTVEDTPWEWGQPVFDGVVCLEVDLTEGFTELGRVNAVTSAAPDTYSFSDYGWRRAAFIGDRLYAISAAGVRAAPTANFADTTALEFEE